jgi:F0F1-type ATP synthase beta subunit
MDKSMLIARVKEWVKIDDEIAKLQIEIKKKKTLKKNISGELMDVMKVNGIDQLDLNEGKLIRQVRKTRASLSKKHLMGCLSNYCKTDDEFKKITDHILDSRQEVVKEIIIKK